MEKIDVIRKESAVTGHGGKSLLEQFDAAYASVTQDRREVYGPPCDTDRRIAALRAIVDECADEQIREVLGMIVTKVVRLVQTPTHLDSWVDIAGYSRCGVMLLNDREPAERQAVEAVTK